MEAELLELMPQTIVVEPPAGTYTGRGKANFGAAVSYPCSIQPVEGEEIIRGPKGEERVASWRIFVGTTTKISPESRLTLPAGYTPQQPPFFSVKAWPDDAGLHHMEILV